MRSRKQDSLRRSVTGARVLSDALSARVCHGIIPDAHPRRDDRGATQPSDNRTRPKMGQPTTASGTGGVVDITSGADNHDGRTVVHSVAPASPVVSVVV